ncbi:MAG: transposase, partial [Caldilineaceae bacterium]|nr:transposase [Caldilineaceae bacterium]
VTPRQAHQGLARYFDLYNQRRPHQALDYLTPAEVYFRQPATVDHDAQPLLLKERRTGTLFPAPSLS